MPQEPIASPRRSPRISWGTGCCPECRAEFVRRAANHLFCCPAHLADWDNRDTVRGRKLTSLAFVARITRNGTRGDRATGRKASGHVNALIQRWVDEDKAANDGRGRMPHPEYLAARYRAGFDPL